MKQTRFFFLIAFALLGLSAIGLIALAADHSEAPGTRADNAADIADFYAWYEGNKLITIITYAGLNASTADQSAVYDENVLYNVHIDNNGDNEADISVNVRFGQNAKGEWGVQVENLPGTSSTVSGPVETTITAGNGLTVFAGLRDDPFFFDLEGFNETLSTATLSFDSTRDSVAGLNISSIVLEMDLGTAKGTSDSLAVWATSGRK